jgi:hypothetical protein
VSHVSGAIKRIKPKKVILAFPGDIITPFYFDACDDMINGRLVNMSRNFMLRLVPNLWKYEFESINIRSNEEYDDNLMELLIDDDDDDDVLEDYTDDVLDTYRYNTEFIYNLDVDIEVKIIHLMNYIRYELIRHDDDPIRDKWIECEYRWRRIQLGSRRADDFLREYGQRGQVFVDGIALD